jgi:hypothetical protein
MRNFEKIFIGYTCIWTPLKRGREREREETQGRRGKGRDVREYAILNIVPGVIPRTPVIKGKEGKGWKGRARLMGLGGYWQRDADEGITGREGRIKMDRLRERRGTRPLKVLSGPAAVK